MPELSRFFGIIIRMYYDDHAPPHFHAYYEGEAVVINLHDLTIIAGQLSPRALGMVMEWATLHQNELQAAWDSATAMQPLPKIEPLQ